MLTAAGAEASGGDSPLMLEGRSPGVQAEGSWLGRAAGGSSSPEGVLSPGQEEQRQLHHSLGSCRAQLLHSLGASKLGPLPSPRSEAKETGAAPPAELPELPQPLGQWPPSINPLGFRNIFIASQAAPRLGWSCSIIPPHLIHAQGQAQPRGEPEPAAAA